MRARRFAPVENLSAVQRGNKLAFDPVKSIEYAVHGKFLRADPDDVKGVDGCWWCTMKMMVKAYGKEDLEPILEQFEHDLKARRARRRSTTCRRTTATTSRGCAAGCAEARIILV